MSRESYESEPKEKIEQCLNCPLPDYLCYGRGNCLVDKKRPIHHRKPGQLEDEVAKLVRQGYRAYMIAQILNISGSTARATICKLRKKGVITDEMLKK